MSGIGFYVDICKSIRSLVNIDLFIIRNLHEAQIKLNQSLKNK